MFIKDYTLVCATNEGLYARACGIVEEVVRFEHVPANSTDPIPTTFEVPMSIDSLLASARSGGFFCYIAGTAAMVLQHEKYTQKRQLSSNTMPTGIYINNFLATLPMRKGLSSSAAVCVLVATAFSKIFGLDITQDELMVIWYIYTFGKIAFN